jgi:hypothetical protein
MEKTALEPSLIFKHQHKTFDNCSKLTQNPDTDKKAKMAKELYKFLVEKDIRVDSDELLQYQCGENGTRYAGDTNNKWKAQSNTKFII